MTTTPHAVAGAVTLDLSLHVSAEIQTMWPFFRQEGPGQGLTGTIKQTHLLQELRDVISRHRESRERG